MRAQAEQPSASADYNNRLQTDDGGVGGRENVKVKETDWKKEPQQECKKKAAAV